MRTNWNWKRGLRHELVGEERGIALVMALGILVVCAIMLTTVIAYTSSAQRTASVSKSRLTAFDAADAGMNNAYAVLNLPSNNSLKQSTLPPCHTANPDTTTPAATNTARRSPCILMPTHPFRSPASPQRPAHVIRVDRARYRKPARQTT